MGLKAGYFGLLGLPNVGKSTIMNQLIGTKLSIVTSKPQTTRQRVCGIHTQDDTQIILIDAPGYIKSDSGINGFIHQEFNEVLEDVDAIGLVVCGKTVDKSLALLERIQRMNKPYVIIHNKLDLYPPKLFDLDVPQIAVSGVKEKAGSIAKRLLPQVAKMMPEVPQFYYDKELFTNHSVKELATEFIRENCFLNTRNEIPFGLAVNIRKYDEGPKKDTVYAEILIGKESHKPILLGEGGKRIKKIGMDSRVQIEELVGRHVYLDLKVVHKKHWTQSDRMMKELGYGKSH